MLRLFIVILTATICLYANAGIIVGNPNGKITLVEVMDYQCPHCHKAQAAMEQIQDRYPNLQIHIMPVAIVNRLSVVQASLAYALAQSGEFAKVHNLMLSKKALNVSEVRLLMNHFGFTGRNQVKLHERWIAQSIDEGVALLRKYHSGTPLFLIYRTSNPQRIRVIRGFSSAKNLMGAIDHAK